MALIINDPFTDYTDNFGLIPHNLRLWTTLFNDVQAE